MLDSVWAGKGTTLWKLCKASLNTIIEDCYWIPRNGKRINVWKSNILGQPPRSSLPGQALLADWASEQGIITLFDLSQWDTKGQWTGWKELSPPAHLVNVADSLLSSLHGLSPTRVTAKDHIGWGKLGQYNVKDGYKKITMEPLVADRLWKKVWHPDSIPKVNSFTWILVNNKLLTAGNLSKRGINGPSRCALCNLDEETTSHIFLQCKISLLVWMIVLPSGFGLNLPGSVAQLFKDCSNHYPGSLSKKPILSHLWASIPKNLCWQLWPARNHSIFKEQKSIPAHIAAKTIGMIVEKFASNNISFPSQESIPEPYSSWCKNFLKERSSL